jgi:hypothetical protein
MAIPIKEAAIRSAFQKTVKLFKSTYRSNPSKNEFGWYHYMDDPSPGITASAVVLYCFEISGEPFERTDQVLLYLKSKQLSSTDPRINGGWPIRTTLGFPVVESTSWVIRTIVQARCFFNPNSPDINAAYQWLLNNQNMDYGWGSYYGQPSRTFHSSLALLALTAVDKFSREVSLGADWFLRYQKNDVPAWGATPESPPTILHTCWALLALSQVPGKINRNALNRSLEWIEANLNPKHLTETLSQAEDYDIPFLEDGKPMIYQCSLPHFALPIAVYTILKLSNRKLSEKLREAIQTIIEVQNENGHWQLPRSPIRPSIWAIWPFWAALVQFLHTSIMAEGTVLVLIGKNISVVHPEGAKAILRKIFTGLFLSSVLKFVKTYYAWLVLGVFIIIGVEMLYAGIIKFSEFLFSLIFPITLLIIQLLLEKRR